MMISRVTYHDGTIAEGPWTHRIIDGEGMSYNSVLGWKYTGYFMKGLFHAYGHLIYADNSSYEGEFIMGHMTGRGTYINTDGSRHIGEYKDDMAHGKGYQYDAKGNFLMHGLWSRGKLIACYRY